MMALHDSGWTESDEPFKNLLTQGMVLKDGSKMSKSKGNIVDPDEIFKEYGADTARFFILSDSPPQMDFDWKESAVEGCYKFLHKVWRCIADRRSVINLNMPVPAYEDMSGTNRELYQWINRTVAGITDDIEGEFQFNTVISKIREFVNYLSKFNPPELSKDGAEPHAVYSLAVDTLLKLLAPIAPHMAEELWQQFGGAESIHLQKWPAHNPQAIQADTVEIVVQVNGKLRDRFQVSSGTSKTELETTAKQREKVINAIGEQQIVKVIVVPDKLVNLVVK
jgi:leucyl-tRNA synthetase